MYKTQSRSPYLQHAYTFPHAGYSSTSSSPYLSQQELVPPRFHRTYTHPAGSTPSLHSNSAASIPLAFETLQPKEAAMCPKKSMERSGRSAKVPTPERSKRFLNSKFYFSSLENNGKDTFVTLTSSNSTWGTLCNSVTLGFTAPLCRVYFVELMFQDLVIHEGSLEAAAFLRREFGYKANEDWITGEKLAHWLEGQQRWEFKNVSFEKMQGNCFAVYCIAVPNWTSSLPDAVALRQRATKKYQILDGFDSVLMLMGRFHNSVWAVFK